ncbi:MAG: GNAT family N-acetyltransferase [Clostridiaceae bacterium]|jgi:ribosomal protein S18 acetylase RimI-like enzyme|nr:GNAT family N-acetyltransferase [Clostridiaceae bacterium]
MITVRKYREADKENLQKICIATGPGIKNERHRLSQLALYCDYFADCEPENIFIAADEADNAVGYILCCTNFAGFKTAMKKHYFKFTCRYDIVKWLMCRAELIMDEKLFKDYGAFLHIDILDGYQRAGVGTRLMDALLALLLEKGIKGVTLGVGSDNVKGVSFYKKYGFHVVKQGPGFYKLGIFTTERQQTDREKQHET